MADRGMSGRSAVREKEATGPMATYVLPYRARALRGSKLPAPLNVPLRWALVVVLALLALYGAALRPWLMNWGATPAEQQMALPGDDVTATQTRYLTRAITIQAPPATVWAWLQQIGQDRAGFYSNDWLENLVGGDIHNQDQLRAEWGPRLIGERVPMARRDIAGGAAGDVIYLTVRAVEPERMITDLPGRFVLQPLDGGATRLLLREPIFDNAFAWLVYDPMHFVMEQRMLRGIKERSEGRPLIPVPLHTAAQIGWFGASGMVGALFFTRWRWVPWGLLSAAAMVPSYSSTGDLNGALAGFLALGIPLLGALAWGRRWIAPLLLIAAAVLLVLMFAPDAYVAFGLIFGLVVLASLTRVASNVLASPRLRTGEMLH